MKLYILICIFVSVFIFWLLFFINRDGESLYIYFLDVGQGDAILIRYSNYDLLVDGGPSNNINYFMSKLFYPFCNIDSILLTHPHSDHMSGLDLVVQRCNVDTVFKTDINIDKDDYKNWLNKFSDNSEVINLERGNLITVGDMRIFVLWPPVDVIKSENIEKIGLNNASIALFIDYFDFEAILLADVERGAQSQISLSEISPYIQGKVDVIKFPHQGSVDALNREFLEKADPEYVVMSVGKNSYGHPSKEVLEFLENRNIKYYRTDEEGTIKFKYVK